VLKSLAHPWFALALALASPRVARGQQQPLVPPVRQLGSRLAVTHDTIANVWNIRQLSDGRVMVNDDQAHRVLIFDSTLSHPVVVVDATPTGNRAYGSTYAGLIPYLADSTIFVDPVALALLMIDPAGRMTRVLSPPLPADAGSLVASEGGAAFDARGRLVYRPVGAVFHAGATGYNFNLYAPHPVVVAPSVAAGASGASASNAPAYSSHDSVPVVAGNLSTRAIDTLGFLAVPIDWDSRVVMGSDGLKTRTDSVYPIVSLDDWAVVSDGSVAFVRARDYHIDWVNADGTHSSTPPIAHEWHRLSDSEKTALLDSIRQRKDSALRAQEAAAAKQDSISKAHGIAVGPRPRVLLVYPSLDNVPDYLPPFVGDVWQGKMAVRADADDHLWIREGYSTPAPGGPPPIYDIVNRQGRLEDRVELPPQMSLAGFGPGVVYLTVREGAGTAIAKYRIR